LLPLQAKHLAAYEGTEMTQWLRGTAVDACDMRGDPRKMVAAMIEAAEAAEPPRRLLLGSDAYALVTEALAQRRADFEANRAVSVSTDRDDWVDASAHDRVEAGEQA
jgi:hypothetical protein